MFAGLFHISAHRARVRYAKALGRAARERAAIAAHNQMVGMKNLYSFGLGGHEPPEPVLDGMDAIQALAYDAERWPHCMDLPKDCR